MANTLNHSPADIIRRMLIALGLGTDPSVGGLWPIHASGEPGAPDEVITVYDTAGTDDGRTMTEGELQGHVGFQVRVRSMDHKRGWTKTDEIQTALAESVYQESVTIDAIPYLIHSVNRIGDVLPIGKESPTSKRSLFTLNAVASIKKL